MKLDLHCHVKEGSPDSSVSIVDYINKLKSEGFDGMMITDHDSYKGYRYYRDHSSLMPDDFLVLKGIEYDTLNAGHFLVIMPKNIKLRVLEHRGLPLPALIHIVHKYGGILGPAHPCGEPFLSIYSTGRYRKMKTITQEFDFIEAFNSAEDPAVNESAMKIANEYQKPVIGGSDSHKITSVGLGYTILDKTIKDENDFIAYIKAKKNTSCGGSQFHGTLKNRLGPWNKLLVYSFFPYNKFGALIHLRRRRHHIKKM